MKLLTFLMVSCGLTAVALCQSPTASTTSTDRPCIVCTMACEYGFVMGSNGCPKCECKTAPDPYHPCVGYTYCGTEKVCQEKKVECVREPCYPIPECKPPCPAVSYGYGGCWESCRTDYDCRHMSSKPMRCCSNGCGNVCMGPGGVVVGSAATYSFSMITMIALLGIANMMM